uniref:Iron-sulfur cluster assembly protein NFU4 n=1 Tax=Ipomoea batatas TaxID=4120 RepID=F1KLT7_IPOBA|nr:iron-sulfur cluster assembly protein NFU4 [Ipomoea batatas]ADY77005.1 iron-sulfur cluster assembly protein NFU4 [Ipomoea batatas]GMC58991.1 nifU-like protein 4, mitochondrial [Ipomoea batatas]
MKGLGRLISQAARCRSNSRLVKSYAAEGGGLRAYCRLLFASSSSQVPSAFSNFTSLKSPHLPSSPYSATWATNGGQRRTMFIQTQSTPNPLSLMFYPGKPVMETGSADFPNARSAMNSPLAKALFGIDGITRVFYGSDFVTVTKSDDASWDLLKPEIFAAIMDFFSSGKPLFLDSNTAASMDTAIQEDDSETVAMIKELLETRIRPAVQDDGGDIEYRGFDADSGIVKLRMQGACSGCPSSSVTLKSGIENMLMHYVPEVKGVEQEFYEDEDPSLTGAPHE